MLTQKDYDVYKNYIKEICKINDINPSGGEYHDIEEKFKTYFQDCLVFMPNKEMILYFIILSINSVMNIRYNKHNLAYDYFEKVFTDEELKNKILNTECNSDFYCVLKEIIPYADKLQYCFTHREYFNILKTYKEILSFLKDECLDLSLDDDNLAMECKKRYNKYLNELKFNKNRIKSKHFVQEKKFDIETIPKITKCYSLPCNLLLKYFYDKLIKFYNKTGYMYKPVSNDVGFYKLKGIGILTYDYDDQVMLEVQYQVARYKMNSFKFWTVILDNDYKVPSFDCDDYDLRSLVDFDGPVIVAPSEYVEEALSRYVKRVYGDNVDSRKMLKKIGININTNGELLSDLLHYTYFKNPLNFKSLKIKDISKFDTLGKLLSKNDVNREKYIKKIMASYKNEKAALDEFAIKSRKDKFKRSRREIY